MLGVLWFAIYDASRTTGNSLPLSVTVSLLSALNNISHSDVRDRPYTPRQPWDGGGAIGMNPPPLPAKKAAKGSEGGGQADVTATPAASTMLPPPSAPAPLADTTPNAQGEEKKPEIAGGKGGGTFLPPPPPKKSGVLASGVAKAAPTGASYRPPSWGLTEAPEASGLSLTVLKSGIEVNSISLDNRTHILLGELYFGWLCA